MRFAISMLTMFVVVGFAARAPASDLDDLERELIELRGGVTALEKTYLAPELLEQKHHFEARLSEGQLYFLQRDYIRASIVLQDLIDSPATQRHPAFPDIVFYLAESLFQTRNFVAAAKHFERLADVGSPPQRQQAIARLLEIAVESGETAAAERYLARAGQLLSSYEQPELLYAVARFHYDTGREGGAKTLFERVPAKHALFRRAQYFLGVIAVRVEAWDDALKYFAAASATDGTALSGEDAQVAQLSLLAIARIYYEGGELDRAVEGYARVPRGSKFFDDALHESIWISIKQGKHHEALRRLDILMISQNDTVRRPDIWLLQGSLYLMRRKFSEASLAFQRVLFEFEPIQREMSEIAGRNAGDTEGYFNRVIGDSLAEFEISSFLPERAAAFAGPDAEADRALALVADLAAQSRDLDDARRAIARLDVALSADNRVEIFPKLHEGWLKATEYVARITIARGKLLDLSAQTINVEDPEYGILRDERRRLTALYERVPRSVAQLQARDAAIDDEMSRVDRDAFKLRLEISALEAQLVAIEKYTHDLASDESISADRRGRVSTEVNSELKNANALRDELESLVQIIGERRIQVGVNDDASGEDERIRRRYVVAVEVEEQWLQAHGGSIDGVAREQLVDLERRTEAFFRDASALVETKVAELQRLVVREKNNIRAYDSELAVYQGQTESLGGRIAARSFDRVRSGIDAVVLQADVGLIDVSWAQKNDRSQQISRMLTRQRDELSALERDFNEATGD